VKIKKSHLKELIRQSIKSIVSEREMVRFKDPETDKEHEITMDTVQRYASDIEQGDKSAVKAAAVKAAKLDKDDKGDKEKSEPKKTKIDANPFDDKEKSSDKPKEEPKTPEAMNDYDWDEEIQPDEMGMLYSDIQDKLSGGTRDRVSDLINRHEELYYEEDYDKAQEIQDLIKKNLDSEFAPKKPKPTPPEGGFERDATAADSRDVRNKVIDKIGKRAFDKLSYGERDKAYDDEFERQGFVKSGKKWVKKESVKESKLRNTIKQIIKGVVTEQKTYKAKKKDGKVVVFKDKDNWKKALKTGDYEKVDSKKKDKLPFKPDSKISSDPFDGDVGGPSYANVPKGVKTSKDAIGVKKAQDLAKSAIPSDKEKETGDRLKQMDAPDDYEDSMDDLMKQMGDEEEMGPAEKANKKMEIDVLNKRAEKGQGDLIDTEQFGMVTWVNGDPDENSFIATNEDGEDIEIDYDEIIRFHNDNDSVMKNLFGKSDEPTDKKEKFDDEKFRDMWNDDTLPKDLTKVGDNIAITQIKNLRKFNDAEMEFPDEKADDIMRKSVQDYIEKRFGLKDGDEGYDEASEFMRDYVDDAKDKWYKEKQAKEKEAEKEKQAKERDNVAKEIGHKDVESLVMNGSYDDLTKLQDELWDAPNLGEHEKDRIFKLVNGLDKDFHNPSENPEKDKKELVKLFTVDEPKRTPYYESIKESKKRRYTVKEVRMWMKKLEENRYKKVYNSDARRVSWLCNNMSENLENMPKSMRKKWSKAQYGRERYLAKEFLKSQLASLKEQKIRKAIRGIIKEQMNEKINLGGAYEKMLNKHNDKIAQNALSLVRNKIMKDYKVGKKSPKSSEKVTRRLVATLINNGMKEIRNKAKSPGLKKAFQKIIDIREKELKKMKEGKLTEDSKLKVGDKVTFLKYPGIIKKVHSGGMKGMVDVKLRSGLTTIDAKSVVKEGKLKEAYRSQSIFFDKKDKSKLEKLLKKNKGKFPFNPPGESVVNWSITNQGSKGLEWRGIPKSKYDKAVEFFMKNKLNPRG